jgi:ubiquitin-protein ligase
MTTPEEQRLIRLKNDYQKMCNLRGDIIEWRSVNGEPPYIEAYELTVKVRTFIGRDNTRKSHKIRITLPPNYPYAAPETVMINRPQPYHPNWFTSGGWCSGTWNVSENLGDHVIRMIKTLQFDSAITNTGSPANSDANSWYKANLQRGKFPSDKQALPDPAKSRWKEETVQKKFSVETSKKKFDVG